MTTLTTCALIALCMSAALGYAQPVTGPLTDRDRSVTGPLLDRDGPYILSYPRPGGMETEVYRNGQRTRCVSYWQLNTLRTNCW